MPLKIYFQPRTLKESLIKNDSVYHLLIIGLPRSGTSYFQRLLNYLDGVIVTYESIYQPLIRLRNRQEIDSFYYEVVKQYHHVAYDSIKEGSKAQTFEKSYLIYGDKLIYNESSFNKKRFFLNLKKRIIDKTVFIIRDPRARFASIQRWKDKRDRIFINTKKKTDQIMSEEVRKECEKWNKHIILAEKTMKEYQDKTFLFRYEDLIEGEDGFINNLSIFLGLPSSKGILEYQKQKTDQSTIGKWKEQMDNVTVAQIKHECGEFMLKYNYR